MKGLERKLEHYSSLTVEQESKTMKVIHNENEHFHTVYELSDGSKILVSNTGKTYMSNKGSVVRNSNTKVLYFMQQELSRFLNKTN